MNERVPTRGTLILFNGVPVIETLKKLPQQYLLEIFFTLCFQYQHSS